MGRFSGAELECEPKLPSMRSKWPSFDRLTGAVAVQEINPNWVQEFHARLAAEEPLLEQQSPVDDARRSGGMIMQMTDPYGKEFKDTPAITIEEGEQ